MTDGTHVYAFFGKSGVYAFDLKGKEVWNRHLGSESTRKQWGSASSPILVGDVLVVNASEESRTVYGLDKTTGKELWKAEAETLGYTYGTPSMRKISGRDDLVLAVPGELWGLNPSTGKLRWYVETGLTGNISPSVSFHNDLAFVFGGYPRTARAAVRLGGKGDLGASSLVWEDNHASYIPTPVVHDGKLYWVSDTGIANCIDAETGKEIYRERLPRGESAVARASPFMPRRFWPMENCIV
ncbi:MAG: PQQ-binding-like beta-propeller repeat protein [Verrucomicrobiota bacterium]